MFWLRCLKGFTHPNWSELVPSLRAEILSGINLIHKGVSFRAFFKVKLLVADLGAKAHMLNMFNFNGFYGCHYCTAPGNTIGKTHAYYPFQQQGKVREPGVNDCFVQYDDLLPVDSVINVAGVKGKSFFASIVPGLPLTAPVDYMHCVLFGFFPDVLKSCFRALSSTQKTKIILLLSGISCPREVISYSRKVRPLEEIAQFKANEHFNWLFKISPLIFKNRIPRDLYNHLLNIVFGIRLLFESSTAADTDIAEFFLKQFCSKIVSFNDGDERIETINVHCLRHLVDQVKRFGPLFCYSAMSFEAANRTFGEVFTGSHSDCEIICRRNLQKNKLARVKIQDPEIRCLFDKLYGITTLDQINCSTEFVETQAVNNGRATYPQAVVFNRQHFQNVYFDSPAYGRS